MPVGAADEKACDAPVGQLLETPQVRLLMFDPGQLLGRAELTPPDASRLVVHQRGMRSAFPHPGLLQRHSVLGRMQAWCTLLVEVETPAATPDIVVVARQACEVGPGFAIERPRG
jgi:hypothetical protein